MEASDSPKGHVSLRGSALGRLQGLRARDARPAVEIPGKALPEPAGGGLGAGGVVTACPPPRGKRATVSSHPSPAGDLERWPDDTRGLRGRRVREAGEVPGQPWTLGLRGHNSRLDFRTHLQQNELHATGDWGGCQLTLGNVKNLCPCMLNWGLRSPPCTFQELTLACLSPGGAAVEPHEVVYLCLSP